MKQTPIVLTGELNLMMTDCNCACADTAFHSPAATVACLPHSVFPQNYHASLPGGYRLAFSPYAPGGPSVMNASAWRRYRSFSGQPLAEDIDYRLAAQNLILPAGRTPPLEADEKAQFTVWLHVTNACNLDCPYCYVRKSSAQLAWDTAQAALRQVFEIALENGFRRLKIKYAGGEALLHHRLIQHAHEFLQPLCAEAGMGLEEVVLSNGVWLPPEFAEWLKAESVKLMISLDGIGAAHDRQRPDRKGRGTFAAVEKTLLEVLLPEDIKPDISITVTRQNAGDIADTVVWVLAHDLPFSLNFYRPTALTASREELVLDEQAVISGMLAAYRVIETNLPDRPLLNSLLDRVQSQAHTHTCGVTRNYAVITHAGKLAQCQMHLDQPVADSVQAATALPAIANGPIRNLAVDEKEGCKDCAFRYRCTGGCPLETYRATGRWDVKSPHCTIYKTLYPEALRLEGLRLLKVNGLL